MLKSVKWCLSLFLSSFLAASSTEWVNCIGNQVCHPAEYCEPKTLEELQEAVKKAASGHYRVHAVGGGYSISDVACTEGCLLSLKRLNKILSIDVERMLVCAEAGITLQELNEKLAEKGLSLSNQAAISQITLGGGLSTGVHGTGHTGTLSSFVKEMDLVTAEGALSRLSESSDGDAFAAAKVGLGALGVIYAVTLQCEPLFYLNVVTEVTDFENIIKNYKTLHRASDFFQFSWNIETDAVVITRWNRAAPSSTSMAAHRALSWHVIDESDRDLFSEIAVPIDALPGALRTLKELTKKFEKAGAKVAEINVRFIEQDKDAYLSPASTGPVACLAFSLSERDKYLHFYQELEEAMRAHRGRPHWGKINFLDHETALTLYGEGLQKFIAVKKRLDPSGLFSNPFTDRLCRNQK